MGQKNLYDISKVCNMLGTTSRTLRFYEEKGIIESITVGISHRRQYTEEQVHHIKNVLVLRALGLSVKTILELQNRGTDLKEAVLLRRAEIYASIDTRIKEINLLNDALYALESGEDIFNSNCKISSENETKEKEIVSLCTEAILNGDDTALYRYISPGLAEKMLQNEYRASRNDTLSPLGSFVELDKTAVDENNNNIIHQFVRFSKLGLKITFVFSNEKIDGLWLGYYDTKARRFD